jgi:hypothetical protein
MMWVKGELLTDIDAPGFDPTGQLERAAQPVPFDRRAWFRRVWRHDGSVPLICRAASEGALCWLFLKRDGAGAVSSLSNAFSHIFRPVFSGNPDPERQRAMLVAIARRLRMARPRIASLTLWPVPETGGSANLLLGSLLAAGWKGFARETSAIWTANVAGLSFDAYWAARPAHLRNAFASEIPRASFETQIFTRIGTEAWDAFEDVVRTGTARPAVLPEFLRETAAAESEAGSARLGLCRVGDAVVAAQFWTVENGVARILASAWSENAAGLSPGTLLTAAMLSRLIDEDKAATIEFTMTEEGGTTDWADDRARVFRLEAYNPATLAGLWGTMRARLAGPFRHQVDR